MALETLEGIEEIGGFEVKRVEWDQPKDNFIEVNDKCNAITFKIQDGPIKENGVNGCQVDTCIETFKIMVENLNAKFHSDDNDMCIAHLKEALKCLGRRKRDREVRGVEGTNKA